LLYFVNSILATLLLLSLVVPFLIIFNICFLIYWLVKFKKHFILSAVVLGLGFLFSSLFYKFSSTNNSQNDDLKVMSYNVRMFNHYNWITDETISLKIETLIAEKEPDVLAIQEFYNDSKRNLNYKYKYFQPTSKNYGLAILSKFPIINKGSLDFKDTNNNAIFIDILKKKDTVRIYNIHLQSLKINPKKENFGEDSSEKLIARLKKGFIKQATQTEKLLAHEKKWKGKKVICGDFNNTAYSWVYKQISENKKDAFLESGEGTGKTFNYYFPMRIDFILTDEKCKINQFKTYTKKYSDHFPIMARLNWD